MDLTTKKAVKIHSGALVIDATLELPAHAIGLVLFAHGSGSSRFSHRNNYVAAALHASHIGSLLLDLLTPQEDEYVQNRFDIALLTQRLAAAKSWASADSRCASLPLGLFGASTGAAAAIDLAAEAGDGIAAVVSRGGRPDLAAPISLAKIEAPTLLIVGGDDDIVIELNRKAYSRMHCEKRLEIVPGASHLFEESGKLQTVAALAVQWFHTHFEEWANVAHAAKYGVKHIVKHETGGEGKNV